MDKKTQHMKILAFIDEYGSITNRNIMVDLNINGATARISELRHRGYNIEDHRVKSPSGVPYKVYSRGPDKFNQKGVNA